MSCHDFVITQCRRKIIGAAAPYDPATESHFEKSVDFKMERALERRK
jgi:hypothetical protein